MLSHAADPAAAGRSREGPAQGTAPRHVVLIPAAGSGTRMGARVPKQYLELCGRTILLDAGRVVANGLTRNVLGDPNLLEAHGLEMPLSLKIGRGP